MKKQTPIAISAPALPAERILLAEELAERLRLPVKTIYSLTRKACPRPIPFLKAGKFLRFRWSDVERWLDEGRAA